MDAHLRRLVLLAAFCSLGASYRTANFIVSAPTSDMAEQIGRAAEEYRRDLAIAWLGESMPNWSQPCPITAQVAENLGAGGATSFVFEHGEVFGWRMTIQGSLTRILDSVLPHEVTHTIFATHFRQPLPRWADEGACTTVEHSSERAKQQTMLIDFLRTGRGIAFGKMFAMKEYPSDVLPLYSQGYSLARYLIAQGGRRKFLDYVGDGLTDGDWPRATQKHYSADNLASLQNQWLDWVRKGSPNLDRGDTPALVAVKGSTADGASRWAKADRSLDRRNERSSDQTALAGGPAPSVYQVAAGRRLEEEAPAPRDQWHRPASRGNRANEVSTPLPGPRDAVDGGRDVPIPSPVPYQVTRPQGMERAQQVILEWSKPREPIQEATSAIPGQPAAIRR